MLLLCIALFVDSSAAAPHTSHWMCAGSESSPLLKSFLLILSQSSLSLYKYLFSSCFPTISQYFFFPFQFSTTSSLQAVNPNPRSLPVCDFSPPQVGSMKQRFSSVDVKVISQELSAAVTGLRVSNIYDLSSVETPFCPFLRTQQSLHSELNPNRLLFQPS